MLVDDGAGTTIPDLEEGTPNPDPPKVALSNIRFRKNKGVSNFNFFETFL